MRIKRTDAPIQRKLMNVILITSSAALLLTCVAYGSYEFVSFRSAAKSHVSGLGAIIAANSTSSLAFDNKEDASEILDALKAENRIVAACIYDTKGYVFATYPRNEPVRSFPSVVTDEGYHYGNQAYLEGFQPIAQETRRLGTLYLKYDMTSIYSRFRLYGLIALLVVSLSFLVSLLLSRRLQKSISQPILDLAATAEQISTHGDYSVRAGNTNAHEAGLLTKAFNHMLDQIEKQNQEITRFNQQLEAKIKDRTRELEGANNELQESNRRLEQFAYVASHDLQEPLRKIQTFSELSEKNVENTGFVKRYLEKINLSANRMSDLIKAILQYSRLSNTEDAYEKIDLNQVLENVRTDLELVIAEKKAVIHAAGLPAIQGIPLQINQLFLNLVSNSLKFCDTEPLINISSAIISRNGEKYVQLTFADNGIGFEQQYADSIFTIFQRLHSGKAYAGTGIGLALCKKIVENHRGRITVDSVPGEGTRFFIELPI